MENHRDKGKTKQLFGERTNMFVVFFVGILIVLIGFTLYMVKPDIFRSDEVTAEDWVTQEEWMPKDVEAEIEAGSLPENVMYGYQLLTETQKYLGPQSADSTMRFSGNNMSCSNCHIDAGNKLGSSSWAGVTDRYPSFRGRSNSIGTIEDRINGCLERSMNGKRLDTNSRPMQAMVAYMAWLGEDMPKEKTESYSGFTELKIPDEAVDLVYGKEVYNTHCIACHQEDGKGIKNTDFSLGYTFPPLWGDDSYNDGAGMNRVLTAAAFIKANMPTGVATIENPVLTSEDAYHVAGYINSHDRSIKSDKENDFPDRKLKPVSTPYGPWEDDFSADQHKFGPFPPIIKYYKDKYDIEKRN